MDAPTYPERNLSMRVYTYMYEGDLEEWNVVGNLVGVKVPPPIPDIVFTIVPISIFLLIILCLVTALKPSLLKFTAFMPWVVITGLTIFTQYSLYVFGHDLDPKRPLRFIDPFTPPVIGVKKIGTMLTYHLPHIGSFLLVIASLLLFWAYKLYKNNGENIETSQPA